MPRGTDAAAPASRRFPADLLTLIDSAPGRQCLAYGPQAQAASADYFERLNTGQGPKADSQ